MTAGKRIKESREALGLSVDRVAALLGKNRATVYRYENGSIDDIPISIVYGLAEILHTTPAYLMGWVDTPDATALNDTGVQAARSMTRDALFDNMLYCAGYNQVCDEDANVTAFKASVTVDVTPELTARVMEQTVAYFEFLLERESATR